MIDPRRRLILKTTLGSSALALAMGAGLLTPTRILAAWPANAFNSKTVDDGLKSLYGGATMTESGDIQIKAPQIAENGAVVPVTVSTSMSGVSSLGVFVEKNGRPLGAEFKLTPRTAATVSTRLKVAKSSKIIAVAEKNGKLYGTSKEVKVTIGGCGGWVGGFPVPSP